MWFGVVIACRLGLGVSWGGCDLMFTLVVVCLLAWRVCFAFGVLLVFCDLCCWFCLVLSLALGLVLLALGLSGGVVVCVRGLLVFLMFVLSRFW